MKKFLPFLLIILLTECKGNISPSEVITPEIVSLSVVDVKESRVSLSAEVTHPEYIAECGFFVFRGNDTSKSSGTLSGNKFTATIRELRSGTDYSCQAFISNGKTSIKKSSCVSFKTIAEQEVINIKDPELRAILLYQYDEDKSGTLSKEEVAKIIRIYVNTDKIKTLEGLEHCPNLEIVSAQGTRQGDTGLGLLDSIPELTSELNEIFGQHNKITKLDLSCYKHLKQLDMCLNQISEIDLSKQKTLGLVGLGYNNLKRLDARGMDAAYEISCDHNPLDTIILENKELKYLNCSYTPIHYLDISKCPKMNEIDAAGCNGLKIIFMAKGQALGILTAPEGVKIEYK